MKCQSQDHGVPCPRPARFAVLGDLFHPDGASFCPQCVNRWLRVDPAITFERLPEPASDPTVGIPDS